MDNYGFYLEKFLWPSRLAVIYPLGEFSPVRSGFWTLLLALITLLGLLAKRHAPCLLAGWLWFLISLVPVAGLLPLGRSWVADRYSYIPSIGLCIALVFAVAAVGKSKLWLTRAKLSVAVTVLLLLAILTRLQLPRWDNTLSLFRAALTIAPSFVAHSNLAAELEKSGKFEEALDHDRRALPLALGDPKAHYNLGNGLALVNRPREALNHYRAALLLDPGYLDARINLGRSLLALGKTQEALGQFHTVLSLCSTSAPAHLNLACALAGQRETNAALEHFTAALQIQPDYVEAHLALANFLLEQGRSLQASNHLMAALHLRPNVFEAHRSFSRLLAASGDLPGAIDHLQAAVALAPGDADAHQALASLLLETGRIRQAIDHYHFALQSAPDWEPVLNNLAWILATSAEPGVRNGAEAVRLAQHACQLTAFTNLSLLQTLAAAEAEAGDFSNAVATTRQVLALAGASGAAEVARVAEQRLSLYQAGRRL
jgi:tetratricopeptide (TPR) repeat protein